MIFTDQDKQDISNELMKMKDHELYKAGDTLRELFGHDKETIIQLNYMVLAEMDRRMKQKSIVIKPMALA